MTKKSPRKPKILSKRKKPSKKNIDFVAKLEGALSLPVKAYEALEAFENKSAKAKEAGDFKKADFERLIDSRKLDAFSLLRGAATIVHKKFFSFFRVNLFLTVSFLLILLVMFLQWGVKIRGVSYDFVDQFTFMQIIGFDSTLPLILSLFFWIFFSYLRASYLAVASNYFTHNNSFNSISAGFKKTLSFMLVEALQIVVFLIGILSVMLLPAFSTRYFLASSAMINKNQSAIDAMLESKEYSKEKMIMMLGFMFFITIFTSVTVLACLLITNLFIDSRLIFWATNFFLFTFLFLPLHSSYRLLLYKKMRHSYGEFKIKITFPEKLWFTLSRLIVLGLLVANVFLIATGAFGDVLDKVVFSAQKVCGVISQMQPDQIFKWKRF
jgi:hypothetical protein